MTRRPPEARVYLDSEIIVDSFAGGGGASLGISWALGRSPDIAINHDKEAIALHKANHPDAEHYPEDVWGVDPIVACRGRRVGLMWLSPDCKHHSKAKGGKPLNKKIRGLAWVAVRWAKAVKPRVIALENVEEFQDWGRLYPANHRIKKLRNRPDPKYKGRTFQSFVTRLRRLGYDVEWRQLRGCHFGAPTIRKRLFLIARCDGQPIVWPDPSHAHGKVTAPQPARVAAECINWSLACPSIFARKKPLAENTMKRIARGIRKFVIESPRPFIVSNMNNNVPRSVDEPLSTILSGNHKYLAQPYIVGLGGRMSQTLERGTDLPFQTICSKADSAIVAPHLIHLRGTEDSHLHGDSLDEPMRTVSASGTHAAKVCAFLFAYYGTQQQTGDPRQPAPTLTSKDRFGLVTISIAGVEYVIVDIGMRMLQPRELYRAQGFPDTYLIDVYHDYEMKPRVARKKAARTSRRRHGPVVGRIVRKLLTKTDQVKMCGNSVPPQDAEALVSANCGWLVRTERVA